MRGRPSGSVSLDAAGLLEVATNSSLGGAGVASRGATTKNLGSVISGRRTPNVLSGLRTRDDWDVSACGAALRRSRRRRARMPPRLWTNRRTMMSAARSQAAAKASCSSSAVVTGEESESGSSGDAGRYLQSTARTATDTAAAIRDRSRSDVRLTEAPRRRRRCPERAPGEGIALPLAGHSEASAQRQKRQRGRGRGAAPAPRRLQARERAGGRA